MNSVFRPGMSAEFLPEFLLHALHEHGKLTMSQIYSIIPRIGKAYIINVIQDMRNHGLVERDGSALTLTDDGRGLREAQHVPSWYSDRDRDHLWHPQRDALAGVNLTETMSPIEIKIVNTFLAPFRTSEASDLIQFSSFQILVGLERGGYLRKS